MVAVSVSDEGSIKTGEGHDSAKVVAVAAPPPPQEPTSPKPKADAVNAGDETAKNRNVRLYLWFTFMSQAGQTLWAFATLTVYLKSLTGGTVGVGVATGIQGGVQCLAAPVAGWAADKYGRQAIVRTGALVGITAVFLLSVGLLLGTEIHPGGKSEFNWLGDHQRFAIITVGLSAWGAYQGVWMTSLETIFADSIPTGQRSYYNMHKFMIQQAANTLGPAFAIGLYLAVGGGTSDWSDSTVMWVFFGGVLSCIPAQVLLFFFSDKHMRGAAAAAHVEKKAAPAADGPAPAQGVQAADAKQQTKALARICCSVCHTPGEDEAFQDGQEVVICGLTESKIPHIVIASNMINGLGAGMTIRFFPLFFAKEMGLSPTWTNFIYVVLPVLMAFAGKAAQRVSRKIGRVQTSFIFISIGSAMLALLWMIGAFWPCSDGGSEGADGSGDGSCHWPTDRFWYLMFPIYLISTAPNVTFPLTQSILMDYVPKHQRGRWNSLISVTRFGWSGSAVVGGFIIQKWGYGPAFLITAIMQMVAAFVLLPIIPLMMTKDGVDERGVDPQAKAPPLQGVAVASQKEGERDTLVDTQSHHSATHSIVASVAAVFSHGGGAMSPGVASVHSAAGPIQYLPLDDENYGADEEEDQ